MRPREQSRGQDDLFRARLDQIIDMGHELVTLAGLIDWQLLGRKLGDMSTDGPGQPCPWAARQSESSGTLSFAPLMMMPPRLPISIVNAGEKLHRRAVAKIHHHDGKKAPDIGGLLAFAFQSGDVASGAAS